jgi:Ca-activated chloride channel homolog
MSIVTWLRTPRIRRGLAASAVVLAAGGLILFRAPAGGASPLRPFEPHVTPFGQGNNLAAFAGPGLHGQVALSHTKVLAGTPTQVFAEVRVVADPSQSVTRAPLSMAIVLDTSGSMEGDKIDEAKDAVIRLVRDMRDDDEVAFVRYSDEAEVVQSLARVGLVRESLVSQIRGIRASGGTAIPRGLSAALNQLDMASRSRVRRVVLASDGLDSTRAAAESLASSGIERGISVSSMGIGLDFDEGYMGGVARAGHGNFAFVKDASALAGFLKRELVETATTTVENATVQLDLPPGVRFVRATGADVQSVSGNTVTLRLGSMFAGDERSAVVELDASLGLSDVQRIRGSAAWTRIGAGAASAGFGDLALAGVGNIGDVEQTRDGRVLANATSVQASQLQLEAAAAYQKGDVRTAQTLMEKSEKDLDRAAAVAPPSMSASIFKQSAEYKARRPMMAQPGTAQGNVAAKTAVAVDNNNLGRSAWGR